MQKQSFRQRCMKNHHIRGLVKEINDLGYKVIFSKKNPDMSTERSKRAFGVTNCRPERPYVQVWEKTGNWSLTDEDTIFVLAHELCHVYHNEFVDIFQTKLRKKCGINTLLPENIVYHFYMGYVEELQCDQWGRNELKEKGMYSRFLHRSRYSLQKILNGGFYHALGFFEQNRIASDEYLMLFEEIYDSAYNALVINHECIFRHKLAANAITLCPESRERMLARKSFDDCITDFAHLLCKVAIMVYQVWEANQEHQAPRSWEHAG